MAFVIREATLSAEAQKVVASLVTWSRLEVLPTTPDLGPGLQAQVADPLWFLTRQWQFNEFQGEDAGMPIEVRLAGDLARLARYAPGPPADDPAARAVEYAHGQLPLETLVERESVRANHVRLAAEAGLHFLRILASEGAAGVAERYIAHYALRIDAEAVPDPLVDAKGAAWQVLLAGRALDGRALAADLRPLADADLELSSLPAAPSIPQNAEARVRRAASRWLRWYEASISEPDDVDAAWNPGRQEYALALSATLDDREVVLTADEYTDGRLDWYTFRAADGPSLGPPSEPVEVLSRDLQPVMPTPVRFPGMPADRYWEFEDSQVNLGGLDAGPTDLTRLLLVEFALVYGNDWFVLPLEMPVGSLFRVRRFQVLDTFGVESTVGPSRNASGARWTMFSLSTSPGTPDIVRDLFFLPPTLPRMLEGDPLEDVALFRDEMANMVWAVERKVQGASGEPYERSLESSRQPVRQRIAGADIDAALIYRLATPVPQHWIPFVPVPAAPNQPADAFAIQLERRAMARTVLVEQSDGSVLAEVQEIHPRGLLLRSDPAQAVGDEPALRLEEEEVPREGIEVQRSFQYTRWLGGQRLLWLGRRKRIGRGEGASGLRFDRAERNADPEPGS